MLVTRSEIKSLFYTDLSLIFNYMYSITNLKLRYYVWLVPSRAPILLGQKSLGYIWKKFKFLVIFLFSSLKLNAFLQEERICKKVVFLTYDFFFLLSWRPTVFSCFIATFILYESYELSMSWWITLLGYCLGRNNIRLKNAWREFYFMPTFYANTS